MRPRIYLRLGRENNSPLLDAIQVAGGIALRDEYVIADMRRGVVLRELLTTDTAWQMGWQGRNPQSWLPAPDLLELIS